MNKGLLSSKFVFLIAILFIVFSCKQHTESPVRNATTASSDTLAAKYNLDKIRLPPGFRINVFAEVPNARSMCWGSRGTLFVGNNSGDKVYAVVDKDGDGVADKVYTVASGLNTPCGVAY